MTEILEALRERFPEDVLATHRQFGDATVLIRKEASKSVLRWLRNEAPERFDLLADLSAVDGLHLPVYPNNSEVRPPHDPVLETSAGGRSDGSGDRFTGERTITAGSSAVSQRRLNLQALAPWPDRYQVVYHLRAMSTGTRLRIKASVPETDLEIDTVTDLWRAADWAEREVFDMFGIRFRGHPNLKRILCIHTFKGHALRKDYFIRDQQWLDEENESLFDEIGEYGENPADLGFSELIPINLGPSHPATHGVLRSLVKLDGEVIVKSAQEIGYLHRGFEKHGEISTWTQVIPYTDRLNYCSAMLNNVAYCRAVEKLLALQVPERTQFIRVIISEISRIIDHLVCLGAILVDLGALTNFWYLFALREKAYAALEGLCGARLTSNYVRIGGVMDDLDPAFITRVRAFLQELPAAINDVLGLVKNNRIFLDRVKGVGVISADEALSFGFTGPCLRACGYAYDLRKAEPYDGYESFDFDISVRPDGDTWSRIMVRFDEMIQSMRIIEQALDRLPPGPVNSADRRISLPCKEEVYTNIESLMNHFMLIYEGIRVPAGEAYTAIEAANGELGFYLVSDGTGRPYRVRCRPPCFYIYSGYAHLIEGCMIPDAVAVLGSLNIIAGELER